ncbi:MAG: hypothetical protein WCS65_12595 [Verrucomicrobiae bacterium]
MIFNNTGGEPVSIEGGVDERGLVVLEVVWVASSFAEVWSATSPEFEGIKRTKSKFSKIPGGGYNVTGIYEGKAPDAGGSGESTPSFQVDPESLITYELDFTQAQNPIEVHPRFKALKEKYGWAERKDGSWGFPEKVSSAKSTGSEQSVGESRDGISALFGVTDWLDVGAVWRKNWISGDSEIPIEIFTNLGRVDRPDGPIPVIGQGRNWIKGPVKARGRGKSWELTVEWMLSGRGGWEPEIYKTQK